MLTEKIEKITKLKNEHMKNLTLLIIDDEQSQLESLQSFLKRRN